MTDLDTLITELPRDEGEFPLYSIFGWVQERSTVPVSLEEFVSAVVDLNRRGVVEVWQTNWPNGPHARIAQVPGGLAKRYADYPMTTYDYDPFGLSLAMAVSNGDGPLT